MDLSNSNQGQSRRANPVTASRCKTVASNGTDEALDGGSLDARCARYFRMLPPLLGVVLVAACTSPTSGDLLVESIEQAAENSGLPTSVTVESLVDSEVDGWTVACPYAERDEVAARFEAGVADLDELPSVVREGKQFLVVERTGEFSVHEVGQLDLNLCSSSYNWTALDGAQVLMLEAGDDAGNVRIVGTVSAATGT